MKSVVKLYIVVLTVCKILEVAKYSNNNSNDIMSEDYKLSVRSKCLIDKSTSEQTDKEVCLEECCLNC